MSARAGVDVLRVLSAAAKELRGWQRDYGEDRGSKEAVAGLRKARNGVAELIASVAAVYGEPCIDDGNAAADPCSPDCMSCRIRAALANVGASA